MPETLLREVFETALRAPWSYNTQPWNFYVVTGAPLERIRAGATKRMLAGVASTREIRGHEDYVGAHRDGCRQQAIFFAGRHVR